MFEKEPAGGADLERAGGADMMRSGGADNARTDDLDTARPNGADKVQTGDADKAGVGGADKAQAGGADLVRLVEALLFLSSEPVSVADLAEACRVGEDEVTGAIQGLKERYARGKSGLVLRKVAGGFALASNPIANEAAQRLLAKPRTPSLTQAQLECLAIAAYTGPVSRPEIARIRGVSSESAVATLVERGLLQESGRSRFGAILYRTTPLFEKLFGLRSLKDLPQVSDFDPTAEEEHRLREQLLKAGEARLK